MKARRHPVAIDPADKARGLEAEGIFRTWLDASEVAHVYLDQTPMSVPTPLRGHIKRPDYLVGIPGVGMVAFDVKSKTVYPEGLIFDLDEIQKLRNFARLFHLTVYFACLNSSDGPAAYWVRLDQLDNVPAIRRRAKLTLCVPTELALPLTLTESFFKAFVNAVTRKP